jgi:hypothetical protein
VETHRAQEMEVLAQDTANPPENNIMDALSDMV